MSASLSAPRSVRHTLDVGGGGPVPSMSTLAYTTLHGTGERHRVAGRQGISYVLFASVYTAVGKV